MIATTEKAFFVTKTEMYTVALSELGRSMEKELIPFKMEHLLMANTKMGYFTERQ